jgi:hypothetical protein
MADKRLEMTKESLRAYAEKKVAEMPPLTEEQCRIIAETLRK